MKLRPQYGVFVAMAVLAAVHSAPSGAFVDRPVLSITAIDSPAGASSGEPQLSVQGDQVILSWIESQGSRATLKFAERTATGWSQPRTASSGNDWFVNWADVPSVVRLADGVLVAHWLQKSGPSTYAYDVRLSYSGDNGRTWVPSFTPHHDGTKTEHGFASLFQIPSAGLGLVWLDGRAMKADPHDGIEAGDMSVRFAGFDRSWNQTADAAVDMRVCECCPTAAAVTSEGPIAAYRNRGPDELRDIYITRLENGKWSDPTPVHHDGWRIAGCPVNGPALAARGRQVAIAWFTAPQNEGRAFVAFSQDAGRTFSAPIRVDDAGTLGRVDVELLDDGAAVVSWIEPANQRAEFRVRQVGTTGVKSEPVTVSSISSSRASGYPRLARRGNELLFAWTEATARASRVLTAKARLERDAR
jgi:hypothetical protein